MVCLLTCVSSEAWLWRLLRLRTLAAKHELLIGFVACFTSGLSVPCERSEPVLADESVGLFVCLLFLFLFFFFSVCFSSWHRSEVIPGNDEEMKAVFGQTACTVRPLSLCASSLRPLSLCTLRPLCSGKLHVR